MRKNSLSKSLPPGVQKKREKLGSLKGTKYARYNRVDVSYLLKGRTSENTHQAFWVITFSPTSNVHFLIV